MKKNVVVIGFLLLYFVLPGQDNIDSVSYDFVKKPGLAALEVFTVNLLINRYDAWVFRDGGEYWAKVTPSSWKANLENGLEWDWNSFGTNWFGHPLHGSIFFNSARSLGMNYWEAAPYAFLGSYTWEYFAETHPPSGNDLLTTSLGGIYLGEMTHRLSDKLFRYKTTKWGRIWRVTLGTIINPMRVFNRWLNGVPRDAFSTDYADYNNRDTRAYIAAGRNFQLSSLNLDTKGGGAFIEFGMVYGDPFQNKDYYRAFETFEVRGWLRFVKDDIRPYPFMNLTTHAILWGKNTNYYEGYSLLIGVYQHFDYLHDEVIEIGSLGFSFGMNLYYNLGKKWDIYYSANIGPSVLGGSNNEIVGQFTNDPESLRDYILGPGFLIDSEVVFDHPQVGRLSGRYKHFTFYVVSGPEGEEGLNILSFRYSVPIYKGHRLGLDYSRYYRTVAYDQYREYFDFRKDLYEFRAFISYDF